MAPPHRTRQRARLHGRGGAPGARALGWELIARQTIWIRVQDAPEQALNLFGRMLPPRCAYAEVLARLHRDTLHIATIATIGTLTALALAVTEAPEVYVGARLRPPIRGVVPSMPRVTRRLSGEGGLDTALNALLTSRKVVAGISTWPWEIETIRSFSSTLPLPIALWLVTRLLGRLV